LAGFYLQHSNQEAKMAQTQAAQFIEVASRDESLRNSFMGGKSPADVDPEDVVRAAAGHGYEFTAGELMGALQDYMASHAGELGPGNMDPSQAAYC
jgi:predicted ribosomally synthesized peptide with nif11-like leader